jgi:hypothetical protein
MGVELNALSLARDNGGMLYRVAGRIAAGGVLLAFLGIYPLPAVADDDALSFAPSRSASTSRW